MYPSILGSAGLLASSPAFLRSLRYSFSQSWHRDLLPFSPLPGVNSATLFTLMHMEHLFSHLPVPFWLTPLAAPFSVFLLSFIG